MWKWSYSRPRLRVVPLLEMIPTVRRTATVVVATRLSCSIVVAVSRFYRQGVSMVSTPPKPTGTASAPLTQDQFDAYVQSTYGRYPLTIVRGDGCKLYDSNGKVRTMSPSGNAPL